MKVNSQNLKQKFLAQLRKHLKSPTLNKILHQKNRKYKHSRKKTTSEVCIPTKPRYSPRSVFQVKLIKKAGEKLKEGFKRKWDSDQIAKKRKELVEYALQKNKVVTASSLVSVDDIKKAPHSQNESLLGCKSEQSSSSSSDSCVKSDDKNKEFYLHCSSEDSSPSHSQNTPRFHDGKPQSSDNTTGIIPSSFSLMNDAVDSQSHSSDDVVSDHHSIEEENGKLDAGIQCSSEETVNCVDENSYKERLEDDATTRQRKNRITEYKEELNAFDETRTSPSKRRDRHSRPITYAVERDAGTMLEKMSKFFQHEERITSSEDFADRDDYGVNRVAEQRPSVSTPHHVSPRHQHSYSANLVRNASTFDEKSQFREVSSENISHFRPNLLQQTYPRRSHIDRNDYDIGGRHDYVINRRSEFTNKTKNIYNVASDSDEGDDETMTRIKQLLQEDEASIEQFFSSTSQQPSCSRYSYQSYSNRQLSDSDASPDSFLHKPFLRH